MAIFSLVFAFLLEQWHLAGSVYYRPELGLGEKADMDFLQSTIGLIWRTLVLWSVLLFLVGIVN